MRTFDLSPLYRSTVGFDRLFSMLDQLPSADTGSTYPPYNIERTGENAYRITMAVAGFGDDEISIEVKEGLLTVKAQKADEATDERQMLYRGIASRSFERRFQLAEYVEVVDASLENGLLHVALKREVPEAMKPRKIAISTGDQAKQIEQAAA